MTRYRSCALRADGAVECWGLDDDGQASPSPDGHFSAISAGGDHACGLHTDGTIACWGQDPVGQATPPDGRFTAVSAGWTHSCGQFCWPPLGRTVGRQRAATWPPPGSSVGHQRAVLLSATGQIPLAVDSREDGFVGRHVHGGRRWLESLVRVA